MMAAKVDSTMMLSPPTWISASTTNCPKSERSFGVSSTIRPVTQLALVAVKKASKTGIHVLLCKKAGLFSFCFCF